MRISDADIAKAEQMDLLTYLQIYEPGNLKRVAGNGSPMENGTGTPKESADTMPCSI